MNKLLFVFMILIVCTGTVLAESKIPIEIVKITDGDTIQAKLEKNKFAIRLIGVDCYETSKIHRAYTQAYINHLSVEEVVNRGNRSKLYLEKLYRENKNFFLDFKGVDKYGRVLGIIYFDKLNINEELLKNGGCMIYNY